ncbi:uncharacterized protein IUM83_17754 [Phytophthora cinnamomi]|uniref:uncharacterized protein n=1 Tax=Phytophthora cinnamomi TaxID=4785 RepID=UPI00355AA107|nr:hypothetical protein IUM83_17754 [Phytophthora cinnamomi]
MATPAWTRERHGRMETARSLLRPSPSPSPSPQRSRAELALSYAPGPEAPAATWASPSAARVRSRPSNLQSAVRASPSFALSQRPPGASAATPLRTPVQRLSRPAVQSRTTQSTQTEAEGEGGEVIHLGAFGAVGDMTAETVDFLIRVLEDRKQELLVSGEDREVRVRASYAGAGGTEGQGEEVQAAPASEVARLQLDSASSGGAGVTELVRSHSYEALVQLEGILEARHHRLMNDGFLETEDADR